MYLHEKECPGSWHEHFFPSLAILARTDESGGEYSNHLPENLTSEPVNCHPEFTPELSREEVFPVIHFPPLFS